MRALILWLLVLTCGLAQGAEPNDAPRGEFVVTRYRLAFVHVGDGGEITNEYVPHDETLENWSTLIAVRVWPNAKEVAEISGPYLRTLQPLMVRDGQVFEPPGSAPGKDVLVELYLAPDDKSYLEYNLIRFVKEPGVDGVKSYQYAVKGAFDLDAAVKFNAEKLESRLTTIGGLQIDATTEVVEVAAGDDVAEADDASDDADEDVETESDAESVDDEDMDDEDMDDEDMDDEDDIDDEDLDDDDDSADEEMDDDDDTDDEDMDEVEDMDEEDSADEEDEDE